MHIRACFFIGIKLGKKPLAYLGQQVLAAAGRGPHRSLFGAFHFELTLLNLAGLKIMRRVFSWVIYRPGRGSVWPVYPARVLPVLPAGKKKAEHYPRAQGWRGFAVVVTFCHWWPLSSGLCARLDGA